MDTIRMTITRIEQLSYLADDTPHILRPEDWLAYITAGDSYITVDNGCTRYTYRLQRVPHTKRHILVNVYVKNKRGDYHYIGVYSPDDNSLTNEEYKYLPSYAWPRRDKVIAALLLHQTDTTLLSKYTLYHSAHCPSCGKRLVTPLSIKRGIGPCCYSRLQQHKRIHQEV